MKRQKTFKKFTPGRGYSKEDWDAVSDNPEWPKDDFAKSKPFKEMFPDLYATMKRGRASNDGRRSKG